MQLFISYKRENKMWVYEFQRNLERRTQHIAWIDTNLIIGEDWWEGILGKIETCDGLIFMMSKASLQSEFCLAEVEYALALNKAILPLMLDHCFDDIPAEIRELKKRQLYDISNVPEMDEIINKVQDGLIKILTDINAGKYEPKSAERPFVPDSVDDASLIYQGALWDIDHKNYERAKRRLQSVIDNADGVFSEMAREVLNDFDFYIERHEMYSSIKLLLNDEKRIDEAKKAWERFVEKYGSDFDPHELALKIHKGYVIAMLRTKNVKLSNGHSIVLRGLELKNLPSELLKLNHLQELNVSSNQLTSLPPEIGQFAHLRDLDISSNQLTSLPPEIGQLAELQILNISSNQLTSLPPEIGQLTNLRQLYVFNNQLTSLPPEIGQLTNLRQLYVFNNQLTSLPLEIGQLAELRELHIFSNQLTSLPSEIGKLMNLAVLYCTHNALKSLPMELGSLPKLKLLEIYENPLKIPRTIIAEDTQKILAWLRLYGHGQA